MPGRLASGRPLPAGSGTYSPDVTCSPDVIAVHVLLRASMDDPVGQLLATAAAKHHPWQGCGHRSVTIPGAPSPSSVPLPSLWAASPLEPHTWGAACLPMRPHPAPWPLRSPHPSGAAVPAGKGHGGPGVGGCRPHPPALLKPQPRKNPRSSGASPIRGLWSGVKDSERKAT